MCMIIAMIMDRSRPSHLLTTSWMNLPKRAVQVLKEQAYLPEIVELWEGLAQQGVVEGLVYRIWAAC